MDTFSVLRRHRTKRARGVEAPLDTLTKDQLPMHRISITA